MAFKKVMQALNDLNSAIVAALDRSHEGSAWEVMPGLHATDRSVICGTYGTAAAAHRTLGDAGYAVSSRYIAAPPLDGFDRKSVLRYSADGAAPVILARRLGS